jgi:hypothetical protein
MTVKISLSEGNALSTLVLVVVAAIASFMTDEVSVGSVSNFSWWLLDDRGIRSMAIAVDAEDRRVGHVN